MASWAPLIVHPTAHVGAVFFIILILSDSGAAKEVVGLASSAQERPEPLDFRRLLTHLSVSLLPSSCLLARSHPHPASKGSAVIRRSIGPNNRRVR